MCQETRTHAHFFLLFFFFSFQLTCTHKSHHQYILRAYEGTSPIPTHKTLLMIQVGFNYVKDILKHCVWVIQISWNIIYDTKIKNIWNDDQYNIKKHITFTCIHKITNFESARKSDIKRHETDLMASTRAVTWHCGAKSVHRHFSRLLVWTFGSVFFGTSWSCISSLERYISKA